MNQPSPCALQAMPTWTLSTSLTTIQNKVCDEVEWLDRKFVEITENICFGSLQVAAIGRVALKTLLVFGLSSVSPLPQFVNFAILGIGQVLLTRNNWDKPWYATTAYITNLFIQCVTLQNPLIEFFTNKGTTLSLILNGLAALGTGFELFQNGASQCIEELRTSFLMHTPFRPTTPLEGGQRAL